MATKLIDQNSRELPGEIILNRNKKTDPAFAIEHFSLTISFSLHNTNTEDPKTFTIEDDWWATKIKILKRDGKPIVQCSAKTLEALVQVVTGGFVFAPTKFRDITLAANETKQVSTTILIPLRLAQLLMDGSDLDLCYDLIGDCSVFIPRPALTDIVLSNPDVALIACGHRDHNGHVKLGATLEYSENNATATRSDQIVLSNDKLVAAVLISQDHADFPVSRYAGLTLKVDSQLPIAELPTLPITAVAAAEGDIYSQTPINRGDDPTHAVALYRPHGFAKISELPFGAAAQLAYTTADSVLNKYIYGSVIMREPPVNAAIAVIPQFAAAIDAHGIENLGKAGVAFRPHLDPNGSAPAETRRFLPLHLRLPGIATAA